ncbi:MAG: DUF5107 domain-containing protein [Tepidisphaeraceae bacterium]
MQIRPITVFVLATLPVAMAAAREAVVRETMLEIPTYTIGPQDKNPPLWNVNVYPYPLQTEITRNESVQRHRAVILENDYLSVIILPDLGGRIYAAHDKTNHDFDFLYHNHVIKPGLVALRGAWISGGIEWNFPTRGHSVNTVSPVKYATFRDPATGSATCVVGTTEWVRRMRWTVAITLPADESRLIYRVRLANPTLTHNNAYFWANAAVHAWDETRVTFPPAEYTFAGRRADPQPWPIVGGKDVSWYKNTPSPYDYFCGTTGDFQGAYNHQRDNGTVHCADRYASMGRKFWTWGTARSGGIWEDILTDSDGQYLEVQSGRLPTQGDTWIFEPHMTETWQETWYPVKNMKGLVKANSAAAVNLVPGDGRILLAVNTTRALAGAVVQLLADGKPVFEEKMDLPAAGSWRKEVATTAKAAQCSLVLRDSTGAEIISYQTESKEKIPPPQLEPEFPADEKCTVEDLYLKGYYAQKHWQPEKALVLVEKALKLDPGFTPALRALAIHEYETGRYQEAQEHAARVLLRNDDDLMARYYQALSKIKLGIDERTEEDLELLGRRAAYRDVVPYLRASLAIQRGDLAKAQEFLTTVSRETGGDTAILQAAVLRHGNQPDRARELVRMVLADDPIYGLALVEKALQGDASGLALLRDDPEEYLEASCGYAELNLWDDAADVLKLCGKREPVLRHPFILFHLGYLADRGKQPQRAREYYEQGSRLSCDYVFPFRSEDLAVLDTGLRYLPNDWKLHYYRGMLLTASMRWQEGLDDFLAAGKASPGDAVLNWCIGEVYREKLHDPARAAAAYERALAANPNDCMYYIALDQLHAARGLNEKRAGLYQAAPPTLLRDYRLLLRKAMWQVDIGQYDEALQILRQTTFHPWEGWEGAHEVYVRALRLRAEEHMKHGRFQQAIDDLGQAMEYPENLGSGKPAVVAFPYENYHIGLCYKSLGKPDLAREYFRKLGSGNSPWHAKAAEELK